MVATACQVTCFRLEDVRSLNVFDMTMKISMISGVLLWPVYKVSLVHFGPEIMPCLYRSKFKFSQ